MGKWERVVAGVGFLGFVAASCGGVASLREAPADAGAEVDADAASTPGLGVPDGGPVPLPPPIDAGPPPTVACEADAGLDVDGGETVCPEVSDCAGTRAAVRYAKGTCVDGQCSYERTIQSCGDLCKCIVTDAGAICGNCIIPI